MNDPLTKWFLIFTLCATTFLAGIMMTTKLLFHDGRYLYSTVNLMTTSDRVKFYRNVKAIEAGDF